MKRSSAILFSCRPIAVFAFFLLSVIGTDVWASECKRVRVVGHEDWPPVSYLPADSQVMAGVSYDLAHRIFGQLGIPVVVSKQTPWKRALYQLQHGELDVITGAVYSVERTKFGTFSNDYMQIKSVAVVRKERPFKLESLDDLIGFVGVMGHGDYHGAEFGNFAKARLTITRQSSVQSILKMVSRERADYAVMSEINYRIQGTRHGFMDETKILPIPITGIGAKIMISNGSPCVSLLPEINRLIAEARNNSFVDARITFHVEKIAGTK